MSAHPPERVTPSPPFTHTGLDYAGPVNVRTTPGRGHKSHKGYIALFVCMVTRTIHLELVSDYSTPTFLAAFDKFASRRGLPSDLYSDYGTTFQGAERELRKVIDEVYQNPDVQANIATKRIEWHFIPPSSPHFGGLWKAGVKSVKNLVKRLLDDYTPTFEECTTLLSKIGCNLNSRPLGLLRDDPEDIAVLTPGHFLIGRPMNAVPASSTLELKQNRLSRWQFIHHLNENFWNCWRNEYLHMLQTRQKWRAERENLRINDIVLIKDLATPPCKWPLARVFKTYPGEDGKVRAVKVKTGTSTYTRPIVKLIPLHVRDSMADGEPPQGI
ncbi:uncharacterized protein LOC107042496 [Diachasma alloeum]|uniref:uncharacterized protein LOC107042496 n=1 Tax=Diachasma alloeum TaxID=454923 RepID=UPI00073812F9|nr:uncharacterized protein LOC107042496 [Diachasma alloeum]